MQPWRRAGTDLWTDIRMFPLTQGGALSMEQIGKNTMLWTARYKLDNEEHKVRKRSCWGFGSISSSSMRIWKTLKPQSRNKTFSFGKIFVTLQHALFNLDLCKQLFPMLTRSQLLFSGPCDCRAGLSSLGGDHSIKKIELFSGHGTAKATVEGEWSSIYWFAFREKLKKFANSISLLIKLRKCLALEFVPRYLSHSRDKYWRLLTIFGVGS